MTTSDKGRPLPKFGEWDVKNPASAEGFTVIFQKARNDKKTTGLGRVQTGLPPPFRGNDNGGCRPPPDFRSGNSYAYAASTQKREEDHKNKRKRKWFLCIC